jgi:hypothetical protein
MLKQGNTYTLQREKALADGLRDVAAELRLIDATDLIAFLRTEQFANIAQLVNSSSELYFKPNTLSFGRSGDVHLKWGEAPAVGLHLICRKLCCARGQYGAPRPGHCRCPSDADPVVSLARVSAPCRVNPV